MATDDLAKLTPDLASLGWNDLLDDWAATVDGDGHTLGRVARVSRGFSLVFTGGNAVLAASASTHTRTEMAPATGDFVSIGYDADDGPYIAEISPRTSSLMRRASGRVPEPQVLAANIDYVFVMHGLDRPLNLRRIERQLVISWDSGAEPIVLLTKSDTMTDGDADSGTQALSRIVDEVASVAADVPVVTVSTMNGDGVDRVGEMLDGHRTAAMFGLSGIGKSTLVNVLSGGVVQRTGEVRAADRRGRHTTVTRDLIPIPDRGFIIDTPGIREIGLWQSYDGLARTFPTITEAAATCRFADCDHREEPDCGVRAALAEQATTQQRVDHWRELTAELALQEDQLEEFERRMESRDRAEAERQRDGERQTKRPGNQDRRQQNSRRRANRQQGNSAGGDRRRRNKGR